MSLPLAPPIATLLAQASRLTTPCGAGELVWHAFGAPSAQPPVVLLHGGSGSWTHWVRNILPLVEGGRQVWVPDLPGFGDSALPATGSDVDAIIEPLATGLHELVGNQAVDLVGFSFGGMAAGLLQAAHPEAARRLVLVGAPALGVTRRALFTLKAWRHLPSPEAQSAIHRHNLAVLMLHDPALIEGLALELHMANVLRDRMPRRRLSSTDILARALAQVSCPVHAIYGEHDVLYRGHLAELQLALAGAAADFQGLTLIPGAGHWVQFEAPLAFDAALWRALTTNVTGPL